MWSELPMAKGWMKLCGAILINDGSLGMTFWGASLHMRDKTAIGNNENLFLSKLGNDITGESGCVEHWWRMDALMLEEETSQDNQVCREHNPVGLGDNRLVILSWKHQKKGDTLVTICLFNTRFSALCADSLYSLFSRTVINNLMALQKGSADGLWTWWLALWKLLKLADYVISSFFHAERQKQCVVDLHPCVYAHRWDGDIQQPAAVLQVCPLLLMNLCPGVRHLMCTPFKTVIKFCGCSC